MVKKYSDLYLDARKALLESEGQYAGTLARQLLSAASGKSQEAILADRDLYASEEVCARTEDYVRRHLSGEPMAYILGQWEFFGLPLTVSRDVLIPRDDTVAVTELAIKRALFLPQNARILDLCTGSGCIGIAIASRVKDARLTLGDVSPEALRIAKENVAAHHLNGRVSCLQIDVKKPAAPFLGRFDMIVANPPYVTTAEMETLDASVKNFEPHLALDGGEDGLDCYRAILDNFTSALRPGGVICFEHGLGQEDAVAALLEEHGFTVLEIKRDNSYIIRAVAAQKET